MPNNNTIMCYWCTPIGSQNQATDNNFMLFFMWDKKNHFLFLSNSRPVCFMTAKCSAFETYIVLVLSCSCLFVSYLLILPVGFISLAPNWTCHPDLRVLCPDILTIIQPIQHLVGVPTACKSVTIMIISRVKVQLLPCHNWWQNGPCWSLFTQQHIAAVTYCPQHSRDTIYIHSCHH